MVTKKNKKNAADLFFAIETKPTCQLTHQG